MKKLLTAVLLVFSFTTLAEGIILSDKTLRKIILSKLSAMNSELELKKSDIEISFSERTFSPYDFGSYDEGEIRELGVYKGRAELNCTIFTRQRSFYFKDKLSINIIVSFQECVSNGMIKAPSKDLIFSFNY